MSYNDIMETLENGEDILSVDKLIKQAEAQKKRWEKPPNEPREQRLAQSWKEILERRQVPVKMRYR